jgi:hypothetical protein
MKDNTVTSYGMRETARCKEMNTSRHADFYTASLWGHRTKLTIKRTRNPPMPSGSADMMLNVAVFKYAYSRLNVGTSKICSCVAEVEPNTRISDGFNKDIEEGRDEYA